MQGTCSHPLAEPFSSSLSYTQRGPARPPPRPAARAPCLLPASPCSGGGDAQFLHLPVSAEERGQWGKRKKPQRQSPPPGEAASGGQAKGSDTHAIDTGLTRRVSRPQDESLSAGCPATGRGACSQRAPGGAEVPAPARIRCTVRAHAGGRHADTGHHSPCAWLRT